MNGWCSKSWWDLQKTKTKIRSSNSILVIHCDMSSSKRPRCQIDLALFSSNFFSSIFIPLPPPRPRRHKRSHTHPTMFKCSDCDLSFHRKDHLRAHVLVHGDALYYRCPVVSC